MNPFRFLLGSVLISVLGATVSSAQVTDPHVTSWLTSKSAQYARVWETTSDKSSNNAVSTWPRSGLTNNGGGQATSAYSDIQRVAYSANYVYIQTTGLPSYTMGYWLTPNNMTYMSWPTNRAAIHRVPRTPSIPTTKSKSGGNGGVLVNGVFVWENGDAQSYSTTTATVSMAGQGIWNRLAGIAEAFNFDLGNAHQPSSGAYHNHVNPIALRYQLGDNVAYNSSTKTYSEASTITRHSPILGWANDGLPIYGPYGYSSALDATSGVRRMTTGFTKRDGTNGTVNLATTGRVTLPVWAASVQGKSQTLAASEYGPGTTTSYSVGGGVTSTYSIGLFAEDYDYLGDLGKVQGTDFDLNRQNVRYCVTPEYPAGTYAYFVCISATGATMFPDIINQEFFGTPGLGQGTVTSISETVVEYADAGPAAAITLTGTGSGSNVLLSWNSSEGATYKVESSPDNSTWTILSSTVTSAGLATTYTTTGSTVYYRVTLTALSSYDSGGTYGTPVGKTASLLYGIAPAAPSITTQPASQTVTAGTSVTFTVAASGTGTLTYQWKKAGSNISNATATSYTISSPQTAETGSYTVTVTNSTGSTTSNTAALTVNPAPVAPSITTQPVAQNVATGTSVTFTVVAGGTAPLTYQWSKNGTPISGATNLSYALANVQATDGGSFTVVVTNVTASATSTAAVLTVSATVVPPTIATAPASQTVVAGASVMLTVSASGTGPFSYQWSKNGAGIVGATNASLVIASPQTADAGNYTVTVTNSAGSVTSAVAALVVNPAGVAPGITTQPTGATVTTGGSATFSLVASGTAPLAYQWYKNATAIGGATTTSLTLASAQAADAASYVCVVTNAVGSASTVPASLTVSAATVAPGIATQPAGATVTTGANVSFSVVANGTAPLTYQWYRGVTVLAGATAATYAITSATTAASGSYSCVVTNSAGSATSDAATLTVNAAPVAPTITAQPVSVAATTGGSATLTIVATGSAPLAYQWQKNGTVIAGATAASLTFSSVQTADAGNYTCMTSNSVNTVTSAVATLTVTTSAVAPTIATAPVSLTVSVGSVANFSVVANGTGPLSFQWSRNGAVIAGATGSGYAIASAQTADAGSYACTVSNSAGTVTSSGAALAVTTTAVAPTISSSPASVAIAAGASVSFAVVASGTGPLAYQWYKGVAAISGATTASYTIASVQAADAGSFSCVVSNSLGSATSTAARLTVTVSSALVAPSITTQPVAVTVAAGGIAAFAVSAGGTAPLSYQWLKNGVVVAGATATTYALISAQTGDAASYSVFVTNGAGFVASAPAVLVVSSTPVAPVTPGTAAGIINLAVRTRLGGSAGAPIIGFVLSGTGSGKRVVVRAVGPTLATSFGLTGALADPQLQLWSGSSVLASNDNWLATDATAISATGAFPLAGGGRDAAIVTTLAPGAYTTPVSAPAGASGIVLVEVYDGASSDASTRLVNASARAFVGTGDEVLIPGFVIAGEGNVQVLVRAVGPSLAAFGVDGVLNDPQITLYSGGQVVASNDNWSTAANATTVAAVAKQVGAFSLIPDSADAALLVTLPAGAYTASVSGAGGITGTALVEVYVVP